MKLSKDSSYLTTFNTPFGRYWFLRLPFGIVSTQDDFQQKMDETFEGIPGVTSLVDDVIVFGKTQEDHDANIQAARERATIKNLKLNPEKLTVGVQEVEYFGHIISADGLRPDPAKVKAIQDMPPPNDKKELQTLLGMITYLAKFTPCCPKLPSQWETYSKKTSNLSGTRGSRQHYKRSKTPSRVSQSSPSLILTKKSP